MSKINDGGPAFPRPVSEDRASGDQPDGNSTVDEQDGMSLRDYLAAKAMQGMMASLPPATLTALIKDTGMAHGVAGAAYELADQMLRVRAMAASTFNAACG